MINEKKIGYDFFVIRPGDPKVRCSSCGKVVLNRDEEKWNHSRNCWKNKRDLLKIETVTEWVDFQYMQNEDELKIFTPVLKKNGRYFSGAEWKEIYTAKVTQSGIVKESGYKDYAYWKQQRLVSLENYYFGDAKLIEEVVNNCIKRIPKSENGKSNILKIKEELDKKVFGQEVAKKKLSVALDGFLKKAGNRNYVLLMKGHSGSGKTFLIETLSQTSVIQEKNIGVFFYDASKLTEEGYSGEHISDLNRKTGQVFLLRNADFGVVFLDEFDKIFSKPSFEAHGENVNLSVQGQMLQLIEGNNQQERKILYILAGAFSDFESRQELKKKNQIGFNRSDVDTNFSLGKRDFRSELLASPFVLNELLGRINLIIELEDLQRSDYEKILSREVIAKQQHFEEAYGVSLVMDEKAKQMMVDSLCNQALGARGVKNLLDELVCTSLFDAIAYEKNQITITEQCLKEGSQPVLSVKKCNVK